MLVLQEIWTSEKELFPQNRHKANFVSTNK